MESTRKTRHTDIELIDIFRQKDIPEKYYSKFIAEYDSIFNEFYEEAKDWPDEDYDENESVQGSALNVTIMFIEPFMEQIKIGHNELWAETMAKYSEENDDVAFHYAYTAVCAESPDQAKAELLIHCNYLNADEHFVSYFLYLFDIGEVYQEPLKKAENYSMFYNKQISLGKSVQFAHEYADFMAWGEYVESYCDAYATAYDQSLQEGKSEDYGRRYAEMFSERVGENYGSLSDALEDPDFAFWQEEMIGNMKGWVYTLENKLEDNDRFISIYDNIHINTYFDDKPLPKDFNREEIDKMILRKAMERYEKEKVKR